MILRRSVLLALFLLVAAPVAAHADKTPKPKPPKIFITLTDGAMNSTTTSPVVTAGFAPPSGTTAKKACKGKIALSAPIGSKSVTKKGKKVKVPVLAKKTVSLATVDGKCSASGPLKIPVAFIGLTIKITASFAGNAVVKQTKKTVKVTVPKKADPPVITPPAAPLRKIGAWTATRSDGQPFPVWNFTIASDGSVHGIQQSGSYVATCTGGYEDVAAVNLALTDTFFVTSDTVQPAFHFVNGSYNNVTTTFNFNFGATTGSGSFHADGSFQHGVGLDAVGVACSADFPLTLTWADNG